MTITVMFIWAIFLVAQNFSFTFVSRARNSASLSRHLIAALLSNGIWFVGQILTIKTITDSLKFNNLESFILPALVYTISTCAGSLLAHWWCLKTEKGNARVGAYAENSNK